jgi:hypothetical protein
MTKFPCGTCGKNARFGAIYCNGVCNLWYHNKCINMKNSELNKISKENIKDWKCEKCSTIDHNDSMTNLTEKILNFDNEADLNASLAIAAEAGTLLLEENENLKQQLHDLKNEKIKFELQIEDKITDLEQQVNILAEEKIKLEDDLSVRIQNIRNQTQKDVECKNNLISQLEDDKLKCIAQLKEYSQRLEKLKLLLNKVTEEKREEKLKAEMNSKENENLKRTINDLTMKNTYLEDKFKELETKKGKKEIEYATKVSELLRSDEAAWSRARWVDDTILQSYFDSFNSNDNSSVLFLGPATTQLLKHCSLKDAQTELDSLLFEEFEYVLCCVNDSLEPADEDSGSHWSLVIFDNCRKLAYHLDSNANLNEPSALRLMAKLNFSSRQLVNIPCAQQKNSFECGINVLVNTKLVMEGFCNRPISKKMSLYDWFNSFYGEKRYTTPTNTLTNHEDKLKSNNGSNTDLGEISVVNHVFTEQNEDWNIIVKHRGNKTRKNNRKFISSEQSSNIEIKNKFSVLDEPQVTDNPSDKKELSGCIQSTKNTNVRKNLVKSKKKRKNKFIVTTAKSNNESLSSNVQPILLTQNLSSSTLTTDTYPKTLGKPLLFVTGDSHARGIAEMLTPIMSRFEVSSTFYPGASMLYVMEQLEKKKDYLRECDRVLIIGGTNITEPHHYDNVFNKVRTIVNTCRAEIILTEIPYIYQHPDNGFQFFEIEHCNKRLLALSLELNVRFLMFSHLLNYKLHYTRSGLHLNHKGKQVISWSIAKWLSPTTGSRPEEEIVSHTENLFTEQWDSKSLMNIRVLRTNMSQMITRFSKQPDTAFSHCISSDIDDNKNMSKGIAIVFKKHFGKPMKADFINHRLAAQEVDGGATIYSLITKPKFFHKPRKDIYEDAFLKLTDDFKSKKLKQLICPPLGCVRDKVSPDVFINNLIRFQGETGAKVLIVADDNNTPHNLAAVLLQILKARKLEAERMSSSTSAIDSSIRDQSSHQSIKVSVSSAVPDSPINASAEKSASVSDPKPSLHIAPGPLSFAETVKGTHVLTLSSVDLDKDKSNNCNFLGLNKKLVTGK